MSGSSLSAFEDVTLTSSGIATGVSQFGAGQGILQNFDLSSHLTAPIPEPGAAAVLAGALAAAFVLRRRGRRG